LKHAWGVVLLCVVALPVGAANWLRLTQHDQIEIYVDEASVRKHGKLMQAWDRKDYPSPQTAIFAPFEQYRSMKALGYYDCAKKKAALRELVLYADPHLSGKVVADIKVPRAHLAFEPEAAGTVGGALLKYVCRKRRNFPSYRDP